VANADRGFSAAERNAAMSLSINTATFSVGREVPYPANLCTLSGGDEFAAFGEDLDCAISPKRGVFQHEDYLADLFTRM
jgi:hypothetical protein